MNHFPTISSTLSPDHLAGFVAEKYGLDVATTSCRILRIGVNHTYLISSEEAKYVLRVYTFAWRSQEEITAELALLNLLNAHKCSVAYPIPDTTGNYLQRITAAEGERFAVLFSYAAGESPRNASAKAYGHLGEAIANMHQVTVNKTIKRKDYNAETLVSWALELAKGHFSNNLTEIGYFERANALITAQFEAADRSQLSYGAIHLDVWSDNVKIKDESEVTIFDFDNCGNGYLLLDVAYSVMLLFKNEPDKKAFQEKADAFYQGYESIRPITAEERRLIPYGGLAIWLHYIGVHIHRFDDLSNPFLSEAFLTYWITTVDRWMRFNGKAI